MHLQALLIVIVVGVVLLIGLWILSQGFALWAQAAASGARVPFGKILRMRLYKIDARVVVFSHIRAVRAGLDIPADDLMTHQLAGGNSGRVVGAMARALEAGASLEWMQACAIDLAGHDPGVATDIVIAAHGAGVELEPEELFETLTDDERQEAFLARLREAEATG